MRYFEEFFQKRTVNNVEILNLTRAIQASGFIDEVHVYEYYIKDGENPDRLAYNLYGSIEYWWVNLLVNNIHDPFYDWPMDDKVLRNYFARLRDEHLVVDSQWPEFKEHNDAKRVIKVLKQEYLDAFIKLIKGVIEND